MFIWTASRILVLSISVSVLPAAAIDPVLAALVGWVAIVLGGAICLHSMRYAWSSILVAIASLFTLCHWGAAGFMMPTSGSLLECSISIAPPLAIALVLAGIGFYKRNRSPR